MLTWTCCEHGGTAVLTVGPRSCECCKPPWVVVVWVSCCSHHLTAREAETEAYCKAPCGGGMRVCPAKATFMLLPPVNEGKYLVLEAGDPDDRQHNILIELRRVAGRAHCGHAISLQFCLCVSGPLACGAGLKLCSPTTWRVSVVVLGFVPLAAASPGMLAAAVRHQRPRHRCVQAHDASSGTREGL